MAEFEVIAEPNRRAILGLLVDSEQSVGEIERRLYRLRPEPLQQLEAWLAPFRRFAPRIVPLPPTDGGIVVH